jgi:hypothetical protein
VSGSTQKTGTLKNAWKTTEKSSSVYSFKPFFKVHHLFFLKISALTIFQSLFKSKHVKTEELTQSVNKDKVDKKQSLLDKVDKNKNK